MPHCSQMTRRVRHEQQARQPHFRAQIPLRHARNAHPLVRRRQPHSAGKYLWNGPIPRLDKERLDWEKACFSRFAERSNLPIHYVAFLRNGKAESWLFARGKKPRRVPVDDSLKTPGAVFPGSYEEARP